MPRQPATPSPATSRANAPLPGRNAAFEPGRADPHARPVPDLHPHYVAALAENDALRKGVDPEDAEMRKSELGVCAGVDAVRREQDKLRSAVAKEIRGAQPFVIRQIKAEAEADARARGYGSNPEAAEAAATARIARETRQTAMEQAEPAIVKAALQLQQAGQALDSLILRRRAEAVMPSALAEKAPSPTELQREALAREQLQALDPSELLAVWSGLVALGDAARQRIAAPVMLAIAREASRHGSGQWLSRKSPRKSADWIETEMTAVRQLGAAVEGWQKEQAPPGLEAAIAWRDRAAAVARAVCGLDPRLLSSVEWSNSYLNNLSAGLEPWRPASVASIVNRACFGETLSAVLSEGWRK